jgi:hypothetical protein
MCCYLELASELQGQRKPGADVNGRSQWCMCIAWNAWQIDEEADDGRRRGELHGWKRQRSPRWTSHTNTRARSALNDHGMHAANTLHAVGVTQSG